MRGDDDEKDDTEDEEEDDAMKRGNLFSKTGLQGVADAAGGAEGGVGSMEHVTW